MMSINAAQSAKLFVEQLEVRCVMTLPWPVAAADNFGLTATYGQFDDRTDVGTVGLHVQFHGGIDILAVEGTKVYAIESGIVEKVYISKTLPYGSWVSISTTAAIGWNYIHITPTVAAGAAVKQGDLIGKVARAPGVLPTHLHLDSTTGSMDPSMTDLLRRVADPLARLAPLGDVTSPTIRDIHFMRAEDDSNNPHNLMGGSKTAGPHLKLQNETKRLTTHGYFKALDHSNAVIVGHRAMAKTADDPPVLLGGNSNIDIIADIYDQMKATGPLLGIRSVEFKATGQLLGKTISTVRPFDFAGEITWDPNHFPPGQQTAEALRISDLTRVVYENDATSPSSSVEAPLRFFHIVTNTDAANSIVDFADRDRYWRSKVTQGAAWNDINTTEAVNNAKAAFPDDYYEFTVTARDAAGNSKEKKQKVLLDNWQQQLKAQGLPAQPGDPPGLVRVRFTGSNWTANASVPVSIVDASYLQEGTVISSIGYSLATLQSDADGNIAPTDITFMSPNGYDPWGFVADYAGGDNIYQSRLDAITLLENVSFTASSRVSMSFVASSSVMALTPASGQGHAPPPSPRVGSPTVRPAPDDLAAFHGTRAVTPAVSKLAVAVPELPADPLQLPGDFDG